MLLPGTPHMPPILANLTARQLAGACACSIITAQAWLEHIRGACLPFEIYNPARLAAFLAQIGHESLSLKHTRELWGPTDAQRRYEGRADLGNTQPGDGRLYLGRGLIQITGRNNYTQCRDGLRAHYPDVPDFVEWPARLEEYPWAARSAAWFWRSHGCNAIADSGDFVRLTKRINGGTNGLADRLERHAKARTALGIA